MVYLPSEKAKLIAAAKKDGWDQWIQSEADERAVYNGCYFDAAAGERVVNFFAKYLRHTKGQWAGKPFILLDWQRDELIMPLYGWKRADGFRRFRTGYVEIPKKNGKSGLCSGLELYHLMADKEQGAEVYSAAADRDQASIVFNEAANMVNASPRLAEQQEQGSLEVIHSRKTIVYWPMISTIKALSAEHATKEGLNWSALIFDELHAQKKRDLWDTLYYGGSARTQPLKISITTAGWDKLSICFEQHQKAIRVQQNIDENDSFFAYIRGADIEEDWTDPELWRRVNPSLGTIIDEKAFAQECQDAQNNPLEENTFKRYRLNMWTQQAVKWLDIVSWDKCVAVVDPGALKGRICYGALDLSSNTDLSAFVLVFPNDDETYDVLPFFWCPEENAKKRQDRDEVPYIHWIQRGLIKATSGNAIDYGVIREDIKKLGDEFQIEEIAFDPWHATQLSQELDDEGFVMIEFRQVLSRLTAPTKRLQTDVLDGKVNHGGNAVMRWMAGNVAVTIDSNNNVRPAKDKSTEKIDGIMALIMAVDRMSRNETASAYDEHGVRAL